jgi:ATP-binding cassette subfamily C (CFTR/MRP) protein 1
VSILLSTRVGKAQRAWLTAIQGRLNVTTSLLNSIKEIRMTGLTDLFSSIIQLIRLEEIKVSIPYRRLLVWSIVNY